ncbi:unnamed protein product, partial [Owenia fusiformis]
DRAKALQLVGQLQGTALAVLTDLSLEDHFNYEVLIAALKYRFEPPEQNETSRAKLKNKLRGGKETLEELAQEVRKLSREAFRGIPRETLEYFAMTSFIYALNDKDLEWHVQSSNPKTLNDALTGALKYESFQKGRAKRMSPELNDSSTLLVNANYALNKMSYSQMETRMKVLEETLEKLGVNRPCGLCNSFEHFTKNCFRRHPKSKKYGA